VTAMCLPSGGGDLVVADLGAQHTGIVCIYPPERRAGGNERARVPLSELAGLVSGVKERSSVPPRTTEKHAYPRFGRCSPDHNRAVK
jgi:hypothetical protein